VFFEPHGQPFRPGLYLQSVIMTACAEYIFVATVFLTSRRSFWLGSISAAPFVAFYTLAFIVNLFTLKYFYTYISRYHLKFVANDPRYLLDYLTTYPSIGDIVLLAAVFLAFSCVAIGLAYAGRNNPRRESIWAPVAAGLVYCALLVRISSSSSHPVLLPNVNTTVQAYIQVNRWAGNKELQQERIGGVTQGMLGVPPAQPLLDDLRTVIVVINESWGTDFFPSPRLGRRGMPLLSSRIADDSNYIVFPQAFTNSTATDVSVPSLLTGVGPEEPTVKLSIFPLLSNLAAQAGFRPVLFSSQRLEWANFMRFLQRGQFTWVQGAMQLRHPIVNDLGIDDMQTAAELRRYLLNEVAPSDRLFLIFATNALHQPFQQHSQLLPAADSGLTRYEVALRILDQAIETLLKTLAEMGRHDQAFMIMTSDHGEGMLQTNKVHRIASFYDYFLRIPFVVKLPAAMGPSLRAPLLENRARNVQNLDLAPTLAHLLGHCYDRGSADFCRSYRGASLFTRWATERPIIALNTNDVRHWLPEGFGVVLDRHRLVFSSDEPELQAFDVATDPMQTTNIWRALPSTEKQSFLEIIESETHLERMLKAHGGCCEDKSLK
jgi:glucan phosphoethanolaminetransferase (alkaline phosphatase superfamily)